MPTDSIAPWFALALLALAILTRLAWRAKWRRDDRRARNLAAGIADEQRVECRDITEFVNGPTGDQRVEIRLTLDNTNGTFDPSVLDEPTVQLPVVTLREELIPDGMVLFRGGAVHPECAAKAINDARPCAGCAVHLDHVLTGAA
jgi:hypothetical protein